MISLGSLLEQNPPHGNIKHNGVLYFWQKSSVEDNKEERYQRYLLETTGSSSFGEKIGVRYHRSLKKNNSKLKSYSEAGFPTISILQESRSNRNLEFSNVRSVILGDEAWEIFMDGSVQGPSLNKRNGNLMPRKDRYTSVSAYIFCNEDLNLSFSIKNPFARVKLDNFSLREIISGIHRNYEPGDKISKEDFKSLF